MTKIINAKSSMSKDEWRGRVLVRYDAQYTWVALGFADGSVIVVSVEEVNVGKWFEVFPLKIETSLPVYLSSHIFEWITLPAPLQVCDITSLWRAEWLEPVHDSGQFLGSGPHSVQNVSRLQEAPHNADKVEVEAGIALQGISGCRLVVCSSDNSPFKIDFVTDPSEIQQIEQFHTFR